MVDVNALLVGLDELNQQTPLRVNAAGIAVGDTAAQAKLERAALALEGTLRVDTGLAPTLTGGLDVRVTSQPPGPASYPLPQAQVDALAPRTTVTVANPTPATETGLAKNATLTDGSVRVGGTVAVSGPLTDAQLRAAAVPVSTGLAQAVTDSQLRAAPLRTVSAGAFAASAAGGRSGFNSSATSTTSGTSEQLIAVLRNPAGSGVDLHIDKIVLGSLNAGRFRRYRGGTFAPAGAQTYSPNVNRGGGVGSSPAQMASRQTTGVVPQTTTSASGGALGLVDYVPANDERADVIDGSIILRPGDQAYWTFSPAASTAGECSVSVVWRDVTAAP